MSQTKTITLEAMPQNLQDLQALCSDGRLEDPFQTAALVAASLCVYEKDAAAAVEMINFLKGPQPMSTYEQQFLRDRLAGKGYVPRSYFEGTSPENGYVIGATCSVTVSDNPYSYAEQGYVVLYLKSSGADSPRPVKLRQKGNQWFLWDNTLMADIRKPAAEDPWA